jgi:hypothetical protein
LIGIDVLVYLEEDIQDGYKHHEGEYVQPLRYEVEHNGPEDINLVGLEISLYYSQELLYHVLLLYGLAASFCYSLFVNDSIP